MLKVIKDKIHFELLALRSLQLIVESDRFEDAFQSAINKTEAIKLIEQRKIDALRTWIRDQENQETVKSLRDKASQRGIRNYSRMCRDELQAAIAADRNLRHHQASANGASGVADDNVGLQPEANR